MASTSQPIRCYITDCGAEVELPNNPYLGVYPVGAVTTFAGRTIVYNPDKNFDLTLDQTKVIFND